MYKLRVGTSLSVLEDNVYEKLDEIIENGFDTVDVGICSKWHWRDQEIEAMKKLPERLELVMRSGIAINAVHISFGHHWDFASHIPEKRQEALDNLKAILPMLDSCNPYCYVIHGSFEPIAPEHRAAEIEALKDSLKQITSWTKTPIAVESLPRTCLFNTAAEGIDILDGIDNVYVCCDVNHFLFEKSEDAVLALGKRIITTHISDHDYENERHWLPGDGKIDWMALIGAFEKIGYNGVFNFEVISSHSPTVLKKKYDELFEQYNAIDK